MVKAIVGANWGDEGKGKITDMLAAQSDVIIRFQGGANAGHTIINDYGKFALHTLPSGVFYKHTMNIVGNGVALHIPTFMGEVRAIVEQGAPHPQLMVSDRAQMMMPYHILLDTYEENRLKDRQFGSTKSGIAPFYADKYSKIGFQVCELFDETALRAKLERVLEVKNILITHLYRKPALSADEIFEQMMDWLEQIRPYVQDSVAYVQQAEKQGKTILLEGQLGTLKDPDVGIYPFVTSSSPIAGYGTVGAGVPPYAIKEIVAVTKAYSSAVGAGPFVSEIFGEDADVLRRRGGDAGEYGATTGRPRRMGWFDVVATRYGCACQGATTAALTAIDVLGYLDEIPVCVAYEIDGKITDQFPNQLEIERAKPVLEMLPGWKCDIRGITEYDRLPANAKKYVEFIERAIGVPVSILSTGPRREEVAYR